MPETIINNEPANLTYPEDRSLLKDQMVYPGGIRHSLQLPAASEAQQPHWRQERTLGAFLVALILLTGHHFLTQHGLTASQYSLMREHWQNNADILIAGDSRAHGALCPTVMQQFLPGRILNYAFDGLRFNEDYFNALQRVLDENSARPVLLFGVTTQNFLADDAPVVTSRFSRSIKSNLGFLVDLTLPLTARSMIWHRDGWVYEMDESLTHCNKFPVEEPVDLRQADNPLFCPEKLALFLSETRRFTQAGIRVYGFRPPSSSWRLEIDHKFAGFQYDDFIPQFQAAGGVWLNVPQEQWDTYDGVHLTQAAALDFSEYLAQELKARL